MFRAIARPVTALLSSLALMASCAASGCKCGAEPSLAPTGAPSVRLYLMSSVAGAIEPCGCVKDMQGGADHAAAYLRSQASAAPHALVLGAGPMLFMNARPDASRDAQAAFKADALADSFRTLGLAAWSPGANDWLLGPAALAKLANRSGASLLAANVKAESVESVKLVEVGGIRLGLAGVSLPLNSGKGPEGVQAADPVAAARTALADLQAQGASLEVLLLAMPRGEALRLLEDVRGFEVAVVGKPFDQGETNDPPLSPIMIGKTLVVETPNHLQAIGVVDLYIRGQSFDFADGSGLASTERKLEIGRRLGEIEARRAQGGSAKDLSELALDAQTLTSELAELPQAAPPAQGSFFKFQSIEVREKLGSEPAISGFIDDYYRRVNDHNREAFKALAPAAPAAGEASYVGLDRCSSCHESERKFWDTTAHAGAYATLSRAHKEFNLDCVGCHVTGYGKPGGTTVTHVAGLTDVQCEVCHGPGSKHSAAPTEKGLLQQPNPGFCASECHHPPHVHPGWSATAAWSKIIGPGHGM